MTAVYPASWPATGGNWQRCAICGDHWTGYHRCPPEPLAAGWKCPVCGAGVAPWKADHCRPKDDAK